MAAFACFLFWIKMFPYTKGLVRWCLTRCNPFPTPRYLLCKMDCHVLQRVSVVILRVEASGLVVQALCIERRCAVAPVNSPPPSLDRTRWCFDPQLVMNSQDEGTRPKSWQMRESSWRVRLIVGYPWMWHKRKSYRLCLACSSRLLLLIVTLFPFEF